MSFLPKSEAPISIVRGPRATGAEAYAEELLNLLARSQTLQVSLFAAREERAFHIGAKQAPATSLTVVVHFRPTSRLPMAILFDDACLPIGALPHGWLASRVLDAALSDPRVVWSGAAAPATGHLAAREAYELLSALPATRTFDAAAREALQAVC